MARAPAVEGTLSEAPWKTPPWDVVKGDKGHIRQAFLSWDSHMGCQVKHARRRVMEAALWATSVRCPKPYSLKLYGRIQLRRSACPPVSLDVEGGRRLGIQRTHNGHFAVEPHTIVEFDSIFHLYNRETLRAPCLHICPSLSITSDGSSPTQEARTHGWVGAESPMLPLSASWGCFDLRLVHLGAFTRVSKLNVPLPAEVHLSSVLRTRPVRRLLGSSPQWFATRSYRSGKPDVGICREGTGVDIAL